MRAVRLLPLSLTLASALATLSANAAPDAPAGAPVPRISVLTMTPGPELFQRFGHSAIRVDDLVYNYGTFAEPPGAELVAKFVAVELPFWLSTQSFWAHQRQYSGRRILIQTLALSADEARALATLLADNALPENRTYHYDFFLDNCATRVRDAIDAVLGGEIERWAAEQPSGTTLRRQVHHMMRGDFNRDLISILLSGWTDQPTSRWEDAFLPHRLARLLAEHRRADGRVLVYSHELLRGPDYPRAVHRISPHIPAFIVGALVLPLLLALLAPTAVARVLAGLTIAAGGLLGGFLGIVLTISSLLPYPCSEGSENLLLLNPAILLLFPLGVAIAVAPGARRLRATRGLLTALLVVAVLDRLLHFAGLAVHDHLALGLTVIGLELMALGCMPRARHLITRVVTASSPSAVRGAASE